MYLHAISANVYTDWKRLKVTLPVYVWVILLFATTIWGQKNLSLIVILSLSTLPFFSEEKNGSNVCFLPCSKKDTVIGRYVFGISLFFTWLIICIASDFITAFTRSSVAEAINPQYYLFSYCIYVFTMAIEFPFLYFFGYAKTVLLRYLKILFFIFFLYSPTNLNFIMANMFYDNGVIFTPLYLLVSFILIYVSINFSFYGYSHRNS